MNFQDALFNWLQIRIVANARPSDHAALETARFFSEILQEDHGLDTFEISKVDDTMVYIKYMKDGASKLQMFDRESAEQLLRDIEAEPKYNN
ncbi:hypothetical protein [Paenibacillus turpanensis]|uniref:hypothetical protein n=1 Tax=Paenibacillus turpanensis TaxID=2689078 RepID=UPI00140ACDAC|nr:hypothetical protein [Paenibacillus turpanensis]